MNRPAPVWLVVVLVVVAWVAGRTLDRRPERDGTGPLARTAPETTGGPDEASARDVASLRDEVASLRAAVEALQAAGGGPTLRGAGPAPGEEARRPPPPDAPRATRTAEFEAREADARKRREWEARRQQASQQTKTWLEMVRQLGDRERRQRALAEIRSALVGDDPTAALAALRAARWLYGVEYDRADFRGAILPHATSEDPDVRRAARAALLQVMPDPSDLAWWIEEAQVADRGNAEEVAEALTSLSGGRIRREVAGAVLQLLRDGTDIKRAFVIRGLQQATEFDADVEARLIEVVRRVPISDYDSAYYFHFITPRLDPKSDAVVGLILERFDQGDSSTLRGLTVGLSEPQKDRAADRLLDLAENADSDARLGDILTALEAIADRSHADRILALAGLANVSDRRRQQVEATAAAARARAD